MRSADETTCVIAGIRSTSKKREFIRAIRRACCRAVDIPANLSNEFRHYTKLLAR